MSTPLAELVRRMSADGCSAELIAAAIEAAETHAQQSRPAVSDTTRDAAAERRRAWDRERKRVQRQASTGNPVESPEEMSADAKDAVVEDSTPLEVTLPSEATPHPPKRTSTPKGTRITADWQPQQAERDLAMSWGWSLDEFEDHVERFRDYWLSRSKDARKTDWDRTFRNRLKDVNDRRNRAPPRKNGNHGPTPHERQMQAFDEVFDEIDQQQRRDEEIASSPVRRLSFAGTNQH